MKKNLIFALIILAIFAILYQVNQNSPTVFHWTETYDTNDKQPYGAYVLDNMIGNTWQEGYSVVYSNINDLYKEEDLQNKHLFIVCDYIEIPQGGVDLLLNYITRGGKALIAANSFEYYLEDTLNLRTNYTADYYSILPFMQPTAQIYFARDSITGIPKSMLANEFSPYNLKDGFTYPDFKALAWNENDKPVLVQYSIGEGELILCSVPLLFSNYSVLNPTMHPFVWKSLSLLEGKPLIRTEYYEKQFDDAEDSSLFRYLTSQRPLHWAFCIALLATLLLLIFTAKRKQKPIPIVKPPANAMLAFVRSIAALYLHKNNNADIIRKKYTYWGEKVKKQYGIDIVNEKHDLAFYRRFSAKTGMEEETVRYLFIELDRIAEDTSISDNEMLELIKKMNI